MNDDVTDNELNETSKAHFSAAVDEQPAQPIFAVEVKAKQPKTDWKKWVIGGATVLVAGIVTTLLTMTFIPSSAIVGAPQPMAPVPIEDANQARTVFIGPSEQPIDDEYYTDPVTGEEYYFAMNFETGEVITVAKPDPDSPQVARLDPETGQYTLVPVVPGSSLPTPAKDAPKIGATTPDSSWKTYDLKQFGVSVQLPKTMTAFQDEEFYRLGTKVTQSEDDGGIAVLSEFLALHNGPVPPYDLGSVPGLKDAKGRQVHIGYFDDLDATEDWAEFMLIVPDESKVGGYDAVLSFGKRYVKFYSDDRWLPLTKENKKDRDLIVAILASVKMIN
jgi:hypothetical protein